MPDQQCEAGQRQAKRDEALPAEGPSVPYPLDGRHDHRSGADGDERGQADRGQGDGGEVAALEEGG
jgi:hypothetical protein